jgi:hypothetical protein
METDLWRDYLSAAIRYWEPRRMLYNFVLATVVLAHIISGWPISREALHLNGLLWLFCSRRSGQCRILRSVRRGYCCADVWLSRCVAQNAMGFVGNRPRIRGDPDPFLRIPNI